MQHNINFFSHSIVLNAECYIGTDTVDTKIGGRHYNNEFEQFFNYQTIFRPSKDLTIFCTWDFYFNSVILCVLYVMMLNWIHVLGTYCR